MDEKNNKKIKVNSKIKPMDSNDLNKVSGGKGKNFRKINNHKWKRDEAKEYRDFIERKRIPAVSESNDENERILD